ncbi:MAG: VWA domain-containing protein [Candidatus Bathyarchaeia archaeon]
MGFIDYAWSVSLQKDNTKVKILQDPSLDQPVLQSDEIGYTIKLPLFRILEDGNVSFLGHQFKGTNEGKARVGRLFRASVLHLTTHTLEPFQKDKITPNASDSIVAAFAKSLVNDIYVNAYIQAWYPDRFFDIAYANALAYQKIKSSGRIFTSSTRLMTALLTKLNVGLIKNSPGVEEEQIVDQLYNELTALKDTFLGSMAGEQINLEDLFDAKVKEIKGLLEPFGPFLESPSLRHTESNGPCSIYSDAQTTVEEDFEGLFVQSLMTMGGTVPTVDNIDQCWRPEQEVESLQAFNSDNYQKLREEKILAKISSYVSLTRFKGVDIPEEDYTQYLRARNLVQGASRRLLDILRSSFNYLDEDPRQEMGQLDLAAVIQSLASNKPATDVFVLDEYLKPSFAWSLLFDVSNSMQVKGEYGRALAIAVAEAARELMTDPTSWTFFAFNDKLHILKDSTESYSKRVRARIGGLKFEGLTYIADAVQIAGKMLAKRFEEQRCLIIISDGWPYGYANMPIALKENVDDMMRKGVIVIGIGVETARMGNFFQLHTSVYTQKDLINKFGSTYANASQKALET